MSHKVKILGGCKLIGTIAISGAKNATLPIMAASLLTSKKITLRNVPDIADTRVMLSLLKSVGAVTTIKGEADIKSGSSDRSVEVDASNIKKLEASPELVSKMRASVLILGSLLTRFGKAKIALPGGCAIGARPIDMHLSALTQMGAEITMEDGYIVAVAPQGLRGCEINFKKVSVGATENIAMAASMATGVTIINNAAQEPEVVDCLNFMNKIGAKIKGIGTRRLEIEGVASMENDNVEHTIIGDRIEAATYAIAAAITNGDLVLKGIDHVIMDDVIEPLKNSGVGIEIIDHNTMRVYRRKSGLVPANITTGPYPEFPTDLQAQMMALLCCVEQGESVIEETIWENRFMHINELKKMGFVIEVDKCMATIKPYAEMKSAEVKATDLRASAALVLAALSAEADKYFIINDIYHIERGYDNMFVKLSHCGAKIDVI